MAIQGMTGHGRRPETVAAKANAPQMKISTAKETEIDLNGLKNPAATARATVLTSEKGSDENTLENPAKVSPHTETLDLTGSTLTRRFPGNSLTILRIGTGN